VHAVLPSAEVRLIEGVDHMGIVGDPKGVAAVADDVVTAKAGS
jgi:hypothetical protein